MRKVQLLHTFFISMVFDYLSIWPQSSWNGLLQVFFPWCMYADITWEKIPLDAAWETLALDARNNAAVFVTDAWAKTIWQVSLFPILSHGLSLVTVTNHHHHFFTCQKSITGSKTRIRTIVIQNNKTWAYRVHCILKTYVNIIVKSIKFIKQVIIFYITIQWNSIPNTFYQKIMYTQNALTWALQSVKQKNMQYCQLKFFQCIQHYSIPQVVSVSIIFTTSCIYDTVEYRF
jgi:hypothetical protein